MNSVIKYILFDAANTLIHKPSLWRKLIEVFNKFGHSIDKNKLKKRHKILSEIIHFPDKTSQAFYSDFNSQLCRIMGVIPTSKIIDEMFESCKYLPWEAFEDVNHLENISLPLGVLSNFNSELEVLLKSKLPNIKFRDFIVSEVEGISKPNIEFFERAIERINIKPANILYIGDSYRLDIEPALNVGLQVKLIDRDCFFEGSNYHLKGLSNIKL